MDWIKNIWLSLCKTSGQIKIDCRNQYLFFLLFTFLLPEVGQAQLILNREIYYNKGYSIETIKNGLFGAGQRWVISQVGYCNAANSTGVGDENQKQVDIEIAPPFWQTLYFKLISITALAVIILLVFKNRIDVVRRKEQAKTMYERRMRLLEIDGLRAQLNSHFIFNCMNSINRYIVKSNIEAASLYLTRFARLIRMILENSRYSVIPLKDEIEALDLYLKMELVRFDFQFSYQFKVDDRLDATIIQTPPMLLQPLLENSIWHGLLPQKSHGLIMVTVTQEEDKLIISIDDNGIGIDAAKAKPKALNKKSIGIDLIRERLKLLQEDTQCETSLEYINLTDESGQSKGTRVLIKLPSMKKG